MKNIFTVILFLLFGASVFGQNTNPNYNAELAKSLEADDYGMKYYIFVILKTGIDAPNDAELRQKSFAGHMKNIKRLVEEEKLILAGPFDNNKHSYRGIFILDVKTIAEAKQLLATDPAIKEGFLDTELIKWYGSAALPEYLDASDQIWKIGF